MSRGRRTATAVVIGALLIVSIVPVAGAQSDNTSTTTTDPPLTSVPTTSPPPSSPPISVPEPPPPETPEVEVPVGLIAIPPSVNQEIAAVLENELRQALVEEAQAVAFVEQAAADAVIAGRQAELVAANTVVADKEALLKNAKRDFDERTRGLKRTERQASAQGQRVLDFAVAVYMSSGGDQDPRLAVTIALLREQNLKDIAASKAYTDVVSSTVLGDFADALDQVDRAETRRDAARVSVKRAEGILKTARTDAQTAQGAVNEAKRSAEEVRKDGIRRIAEAQSRAPSLPSTELGGGLSILGQPLVQAADLAAFVKRSGFAHKSIDIDALAEAFIAEGRAEGVRSDVAWVQSIIETGWFSFKGSMVKAEDFNYAGVGACDSCSRGTIFASMTDGVRTQVQLVRTYATKGLSTSDLANPPPRLVPERSHVRGCCDTWMKLSGVWATGPGYGVKILTIYNQLLSFAASRRAR